MSDDVVGVTVPHPEQGEVTMTLPQAFAAADCLAAMKLDGKEPTWHRNECECCVTVHENVKHPTGGYLIGSDGEYDWIDV